MGYTIGLIGVWLSRDSIYSIFLYWNAPSYEGSQRQTFRRDHWVRVVRGLIGVALIVLGAII